MKRVFGRGLNITAQLNSSRQNLKQFTEITELNNFQVTNLGCGYLQSLFLLSDGQFISCGHYMDSLTCVRLIKWNSKFSLAIRALHKIPYLGKFMHLPGSRQKLTLLNRQEVEKGITFRKAIISHSSAYIISHGNQAFCIGQNYYGKLGTGQEIAIQHAVVQLPKINRQNIFDIACGFQHTVFITQQTKYLYGCGKAEYHQIQPQFLQRQITSSDSTITTLAYAAQPHLIWSKSKVSKAACGFRNTLFLTEENKLYALGNNKYGQCGINNQTHPQLPKAKQVFFPKNQKILDLVCGNRHSLILTENQVYFTGSIQQNQNPFKKFDQNICAFTPLNLPSRPIKIFAQFDRSAIILQDGRAVIFGGKNLTKIGGQSDKLEFISQFKFDKDSLIGLGFGHTLLYV